MLDFLETVLACWRIASLLVHEDGPWGVFARLRYRVGLRSVVRQDANGHPAVAKAAMNTWAEGLTCVWCVTMWVAVVDFVLRRIPVVRTVWAAARTISAASAGAIVVQSLVEHERGRTE